MNNLVERNESPSKAINKIVWIARTIRDNIEAFEILQTRQKPTIALCMGEAGLISRVLAKKFGAFLTFASLRDEVATAPGQVTIARHEATVSLGCDRPANQSLRRGRLPGRSIRCRRRSTTPRSTRPATTASICRCSFNRNTKLQGVHGKLPARSKPLDLSGLSITIPHKENALRYLKEKGAEIEPLAERIGAVNTIVISASMPLKWHAAAAGT